MNHKGAIIETMVSDIDDRRFDAFTSGRSIVAAQIAALSASGYAILPVEPTDEMKNSGESVLVMGPLQEHLDQSPSHTWAAAWACYSAMIRAANKEGL